MSVRLRAVVKPCPGGVHDVPHLLMSIDPECLSVCRSAFDVLGALSFLLILTVVPTVSQNPVGVIDLMCPLPLFSSRMFPPAGFVEFPYAHYATVEVREGDSPQAGVGFLPVA